MKVVVDVGSRDAGDRLIALLKHLGYSARIDGSASTYEVMLERWDRMAPKLLRAIAADLGSIRKAARALGLPRSTLGAWLKPGGKPRARRGDEPDEPPSYIEF
jgi:transcriptional regulator of acetoin/glycerol metabolism